MVFIVVYLMILNIFCLIQLSNDENWRVVMKLNSTGDVAGAKTRYRIDQENEARRRAAQEEARRQIRTKNFRKRMFAAIQILGGSRPYEFLFSACPLITAILTILKLDHRMDATWPEVMIPMFWFVANIVWQPFLYMLWSLIMHFRGIKDSFQGMYDDRGWLRPMLFRYACYIGFEGSVNGLYFLAFGVYVLIATMILLPMGWFANHCVQGDVCDSPGIYYFIPILIVLVVGAVGVAIFLGGDMRFERIFIPPLLVTAAIGIILVMLNVDEFVHWSWRATLTPFYILTGMMTVEIAVSLIFMCAKRRYYRDHSALGYEYEIFRIVLIVLLIFCVIPTLVFVCLSGYFFDGLLEISYAKLFSPLLIMFSGFIIAYVFMYVLLHG